MFLFSCLRTSCRNASEFVWDWMSHTWCECNSNWFQGHFGLLTGKMSTSPDDLPGGWTPSLMTNLCPTLSFNQTGLYWVAYALTVDFNWDWDTLMQCNIYYNGQKKIIKCCMWYTLVYQCKPDFNIIVTPVSPKKLDLFLRQHETPHHCQTYPLGTG